MSPTYAKPTRAAQSVKPDALIVRLAIIAARKGWGEQELLHILFNQGAGRKTLTSTMYLLRVAGRA